MRIAHGLSLAVALLLTGPTVAHAEIPDGRFAFDKRCATCHDATALTVALAKRADDKERRAFLEKFLSRHHARDLEERAAIIDYLLNYQAR